MSEPAPALHRIRAALGRSPQSAGRGPRPWAAAYLAAVALVLVVLAAAPLRQPLLARVERALASWDMRWADQVRHGEWLAGQGRHEEAVAWLTALDRDFPARDSHHRHSVRRARLLEALGRSHEALGQKRRALDAYRRALALFPRDYRRHLVMAEACVRLGEPDDALDHFARVQQILPWNPDALAGRVAIHFERGDFRSVVDAYAAFLDALELRGLEVAVGDSVASARVIADGRPHEVELAFPDTPAAGSLEIRPGALPAVIEQAWVEPAQRVGAPGTRPERLALGPDGGAGETGLRLAPPDADRGTPIARLILRARFPKPVAAETWSRVRTSYRNLLAFDALGDAERRSFVMRPDPDSAVTRAASRTGSTHP